MEHLHTTSITVFAKKYTPMKINNELSTKIEALREAGLGYGRIAKQLELKRGTVAKHCQKKDHLSKLPPKEARYQGSIKDRNCLKIKQFILANPTATLGDIHGACELTVSVSSLWRYLKHNDLQLRIAKKAICVSDVNKEKRVAFAKEWVRKPDEVLESIWFSDETMVQSRPNGEVVTYRAPKGSGWVEPSNSSSGKSVMFWGVVSRQAYGPITEVIGKNTALNYVETLKETLLPELEVAQGPVIFQQDNAPIHKTDAVMAFLEENQIETIEWPPQSPDLSPIENIWNVLKMKMKALRPRPRTYARMRGHKFNLARSPG
jgi:hypothetical protein